jgi:hypothetical protein
VLHFLVLNTLLKQECPFMSVQITNGACCLLFEGSKDHALFSNLDEELEVLIKGMDNAVLKAEPSDTALESRVSWQKEEVPKEPYVGSVRNLLLYHPGTYLSPFSGI